MRAERDQGRALCIEIVYRISLIYEIIKKMSHCCYNKIRNSKYVHEIFESWYFRIIVLQMLYCTILFRMYFNFTDSLTDSISKILQVFQNIFWHVLAFLEIITLLSAHVGNMRSAKIILYDLYQNILFFSVLFISLVIERTLFFFSIKARSKLIVLAYVKVA